MTAKAAKAPTKKAKTAKPKPTATSKPKLVAKSTDKKPTYKKPADKKPTSAKGNLRAWNLRAGILLLLLAVAVVVFGNSTTASFTTQYLAKDTLSSEAAGHEVLATATRHLWDVNLSWLVAKLLVIFGVVFLLAATLLRKKYEAWLDRGVNALRWVGLGVGGGAVFTTVAMLSGVSDVSTLCLIFASVALAGLLTATIEFVGPGRHVRRLLAIGALVAVFVPWLIFVRTAGAVVMFDGSLPMYMYYLYASGTLLVVAVALATGLRIKQRGKWADTFYTERMFMVLTFIVATIPALQIFAGALQP